MATWRRRLTLAILAVVLVSGCGRESTRRPDTGAEATAKGYYDALLRQDWPAAYAALAPDSRLRYSADEFARLARSHRRALGFEAEEVVVRSCEEQGDEAVVHVVFRGQSGARQRTYRDGITLRRNESGWGVVLPPRFGQTR